MTSVSSSISTQLEQCSFTHLHQVDELTVLSIKHPIFQANIALQGAQLLSFQPIDQQPWIWLSPEAEYKQGQSLRGGIPICWPWFGVANKNPQDLAQQIQPDPNSASSHGFARAIDWDLMDIQESAHNVVLTLQLSYSPETLKVWPFEFKLRCTFTLGRTLKVDLETENQSQSTMKISQALHTYFPCKAIDNVRIHNTASKTITDALNGWSTTTQAGNQGFSGEVDRIYHTGGPFRLETGLQPLTLQSQNSHTSVIWNPWITKSKGLSQFADHRYQEMFCVETANVLDDCKTLQPNETTHLSLAITPA